MKPITKLITIRRPDDWHVHFRDGAVLRKVAPATAQVFGRAIVMPNLVPPVTTTKLAAFYRERILSVIPPALGFTPLMTCYLTDDTDAHDVTVGHSEGVLTAAKLYPAHATTNSAHGVTDIRKLDSVFAAMAECGMPLLVHGEVVRHDVDIFDREERFIDEVLSQLVERHPTLKIVMEHITTAEAVAFVRRYPDRVGATLTPQHLMLSRNAIFEGGIRPHMYCLPVLKRERHRLALRAAATSGEASFFLGTDSAPHLRHLKENACGCAGIFSAPVAIQAYLRVFEEEDALQHFEAFASLNGPRFYGLPPNDDRLTLTREPCRAPAELEVEGAEGIVCFLAGEDLAWTAKIESAESPKSWPGRSGPSAIRDRV